MLSDFSFCGTLASSIGLEYAPDLENTYVHSPAVTTVHEETFDGHTGGYIYSAWRQPKEFVLRCYFEQTRIDLGFMSKLHSVFRVGRSGKLVFERRPWCYYYATVTEVNDKNLTNYQNGIITITMRAPYPFARTDILYNERVNKYHDEIMANTALYEKAEMVTPTTLTNITGPTSIVIGNPGTERAHLAVAIAGNVGDGVTIGNNTTGQSMKIVALSKAVTSDVNTKLIVDSISGKTVLSGPQGKSLAFMFHEYGFLDLEPAFPVMRNLFISFVDGFTVTLVNKIHENLIGQYVYIDDEGDDPNRMKWHKIVEQPDEHTFTVSGRINGTGTHRTCIMRMNEIQINPVSTMDLDEVSFIFKPTFA